MPSEKTVTIAVLVVFGAGYVGMSFTAIVLELEVAVPLIAGWIVLTFVFLGKTRQLVELAEALDEMK